VIAVEYRDADTKMIVVHIRDEQDDFLMEYDGFAQKKRGRAMKHLIAQIDCQSLRKKRLWRESQRLHRRIRK
jgi:hypothetical protein